MFSDRVVWFGGYAILFVFFALSGFLITASALRLGLSNFLINRSLRIFPALIVEIILSAFILGPIFTILPIGHYLSSTQTLQYFTNIIGLINYRLPGVFLDHPYKFVNASLWTVPYEFGCYALMAGLIISGLLRRPGSIVVMIAISLIAGLLMMAAGVHGREQGGVDSALRHLFFDRGSRLFVAFLGGILTFQLRYRLPYSWRWFGLATALCVICAIMGEGQYPFPATDTLFFVPLCYIMAFLGVSAIPKLPFFHRGDYSYGIYLYGWPVTQAVRGVFPETGSHPFWLFMMSIVPITLFAAFSWHVIEKPVLRLRRRFSFVARQRLAQSDAQPSLAGAECDHSEIESSDGQVPTKGAPYASSSMSQYK